MATTHKCGQEDLDQLLGSQEAAKQRHSGHIGSKPRSEDGSLSENELEGVAEASGYTAAPTMLHCCWGVCSPRRQMSPIHWDWHILSTARPCKFTMLSLRLCF